MKSELFKIEFKRGIETLMPYAREHKGGVMRTKIEMPAEGHRHQFPPYTMLLTIEAFPGADCPMVSLSAPMRPIKFLNDVEKSDAKEAFSEVFPEHRIIVTKPLLRGTTAFKMIALPPGAPQELVETYQALEIPR